MNLSQIIKLMYRYVGQSTLNQPDFVPEMVGWFLQPGSDNPIRNKDRSAWEKYFAGTRKFQKADASLILSARNKRGFTDKIDAISPSDKKMFAEEVRGNGFPCTDETVAEVYADIFEGILNALAKGEKEVTPEDINLQTLITENDVPLLQEVGNRCPLCREPLLHVRRGKNLWRYKVVRIFPPDLDAVDIPVYESIKSAPSDPDSVENKIAMCPDDAEMYEYDPDPEDYRRLTEIKERLIQSAKLEREMNSIHLEEEIREVVYAISRLSSGQNLRRLRLSALNLDDKIAADNFPLKEQIKNCSVTYYYFIQDLFTDIEESEDVRFRKIASEIIHGYETLNNGTLTQDEIYSRLAEWIKDQLGMSDQYLNACLILAAFFVQDCEVF